MKRPLGADLLAVDIGTEFGPCALTENFIDENYDALPQQPPEEFKRRLPGYMLRSLERWSPKNMVCEFTIYSLDPGKAYLERGSWAARFSVLSKGQIDIVLRFLALVREDPDFANIYEAVKRAPERIQRLVAMQK